MDEHNDTESDSIDADEFAERVDEIEGEDQMADSEDLPELLGFNDLLEMREDLTGLEDDLDATAGYWSQTVLVLEEQVEVAEKLGETEKKEALQSTLERVEEVALRIDEGRKIGELREQLSAAE